MNHLLADSGSCIRGIECLQIFLDLFPERDIGGEPFNRCNQSLGSHLLFIHEEGCVGISQGACVDALMLISRMGIGNQQGGTACCSHFRNEGSTRASDRHSGSPQGQFHPLHERKDQSLDGGL